MDTIKITISGPQASGKTLLANLIAAVIRETGIRATLEGEPSRWPLHAEATVAKRAIRQLGVVSRTTVVIETTNEPERKPHPLEPITRADYVVEGIDLKPLQKAAQKALDLQQQFERFMISGARPRVTQTGRLSVNTGPTTKPRAANWAVRLDRWLKRIDSIPGLVGTALYRGNLVVVEISRKLTPEILEVKLWNDENDRRTGVNGIILARVRPETFKPYGYRNQNRHTKPILKEIWRSCAKGKD
jgi:hypothetical protein